MKRLNDREQRYAYLGTALAAAASVALWAPSFDKRAGVALAGIGLVMSALLAIAAKRRHRLFTGLACVLLAFGPWGMAWVVGLPFLILAAWLALKSNRLQPRAELEVDEHGELVLPVGGRPAEGPRRPRPPRRRRRRPSDGDGGEEHDGAPPATSGAGPRTPPPASKRYTPPQRRP